jgi:hypothetical protein
MVLPTFPSAEALGYLQPSLRDLDHLRDWILGISRRVEATRVRGEATHRDHE